MIIIGSLERGWGLGVALADLGGRIVVAWKIGRRAKSRRFRNPFRIRLTYEEHLAGKPHWRFPVSLWARR